MKKSILIIALSLFALQVFAQQETLFSKSRAMGFFGAPIVEFGTVAGEYNVSSGGGGGIIVDNFFIGAYGLGSSDFESIINENEFRAEIAHGGLWLGYNLNSQKLFHPYSTLKIGWGVADIRINENGNISSNDWDSIFAITPEVGLELNVTKFFHIAASAGYRWVDGVNDNANFSNEDFRNLNASLTFRFGWFGSWKDKGDGRRGLWQRGSHDDCD